MSSKPKFRTIERNRNRSRSWRCTTWFDSADVQPVRANASSKPVFNPRPVLSRREVRR